MNRKQVDPAWLRAEYVEKQRTCADIGAELGVRHQTISKWLRFYGIDGRRTGPPDGERHPGWKGGTTIDKGGYILQYQPDHPNANSNGYIRQHRLVAEQLLGRHLEPGEVVHHVDGNPSNNDPSNLVVFRSNGDHLKLELTGKRPKWSADGWSAIRAGFASRQVHFDDDELLRDYNAKMRFADMALKHHASENCIRTRLKKLGATLRGSGNRYTAAERRSFLA